MSKIGDYIISEFDGVPPSIKESDLTADDWIPCEETRKAHSYGMSVTEWKEANEEADAFFSSIHDEQSKKQSSWFDDLPF